MRNYRGPLHHCLSTVRWRLHLRLRHHHTDMSTKQVVHRRQDPLPETMANMKQMGDTRQLHILKE